jgi:hypothetical protein
MLLLHAFVSIAYKLYKLSFFNVAYKENLSISFEELCKLLVAPPLATLAAAERFLRTSSNALRSLSKNASSSSSLPPAAARRLFLPPEKEDEASSSSSSRPLLARNSSSTRSKYVNAFFFCLLSRTGTGGNLPNLDDLLDARAGIVAVFDANDDEDDVRFRKKQPPRREDDSIVVVVVVVVGNILVRAAHIFGLGKISPHFASQTF